MHVYPFFFFRQFITRLLPIPQVWTFMSKYTAYALANLPSWYQIQIVERRSVGCPTRHGLDHVTSCFAIRHSSSELLRLVTQSVLFYFFGFVSGRICAPGDHLLSRVVGMGGNIRYSSWAKNSPRINNRLLWVCFVGVSLTPAPEWAVILFRFFFRFRG